MHQAYVRQMANARLGTHKTKTRSEVKMTTAKMYRQKGTGRARHGAKNAPQFVGGGQAHGPVPHKYTKDMPKKMARAALRNALSAAMLDDQLVIVDTLSVKVPKTKKMAKVLTRWSANSRRWCCWPSATRTWSAASAIWPMHFICVQVISTSATC